MNVILVLFAILVLIGIRIRKKDNSNYMSPKQTRAINGAFVILVFLRHFRQYITYGEFDLIFKAVDGWLGQLIVVTFLFYSGFGVMFSLRNKSDYVRTLPQRMLRVLVQFDIAIVAFIIVDLIIKAEYSFSDYLFSFIGWSSIGNSNWYIFAILCMYLVTYFAALICKKKYFLIVVFVVLGSCIYTIFMYLCGKSSYCFDTIFCYSAGMLYCLCYERIGRLIEKSKMALILNLLIPLGVFVLCLAVENCFDHYMLYLLVYYIKGVSFALTIIGFSAIFEIYNPVLNWLGRYLFEIYILQRIPMRLFNNSIENKYVYFVICALVTIVLSLLFKKVEGFINSKGLLRKKLT